MGSQASVLAEASVADVKPASIKEWFFIIGLIYILLVAVAMIGGGFKAVAGENAKALFGFAQKPDHRTGHRHHSHRTNSIIKYRHLYHRGPCCRRLACGHCHPYGYGSQYRHHHYQYHCQPWSRKTGGRVQACLCRRDDSRFFQPAQRHNIPTA